MIEPISPRLNRSKYAATLVGASAVAALPSVGLAAIASAEKVWDIETYDYCMVHIPSDIATVFTVSQGNELAS